MSSVRKIDEISKSTADSKTSDRFPTVRKLHEYMASGEGVIISCCNKQKSGCHCFAKTLHDSYPKLDMAKIVINQDLMNPIPCDVDTITQNCNWDWNYWKAGILVGCEWMQERTPDSILAHLEQIDFRFIGIKEIFVLATPHQQRNYLASYQNCPELAARLDTRYEWNWVPCGLDCSLPYSLGMPNPFGILPESKYTIPKTCFGFGYFGKAFDLKNRDQYLSTYFSQVFFQASKFQKYLVTTPTVMIIDQAVLDRMAITRLGDKYKVTIQFVNRLEPQDFKQAMTQLAEKDGVFASDGVQSISQAAFVGVKFFAYQGTRDRNNDSFYNQMATLLPASQQPNGRQVLGLSSKYEKIEDDKQFQELQIGFKVVQRQPVDRFDRDKKQAEETLCQRTAMQDAKAENESPEDYRFVPLFTAKTTLFAKEYQDRVQKTRRVSTHIRIKYFPGKFCIAAFKRNWLQQQSSEEIQTLARGLKIRAGLLS